MRIIQLTRCLLFRYVLKKQVESYTEVEINILVCIYLMNNQAKRCSCNTLINYLSKLNRTPSRKKLLYTLRRFKDEGIVRVFGKGPGTNVLLTTLGKIYLNELEDELKGIRSIN